DELGYELGEAFAASLRPAVFDRDRASFDPAEFAQPLHKSSGQLALRGRRSRAQESDGRQLPRRLRAHRERPCGRAAEQRDELAALHVWMAPAWQEIIWRAAQRSLAVMCPACWCSPGGLLALMGSANRVLIIRTGSMSR